MLMYNTKENPIIINNSEDIDKIPIRIWMKWNCKYCGKDVIIMKRNNKNRIIRYKTLLCQPCYTKTIKLEKYGDPNYNNKEQALKTWYSKSKNELAYIAERRRETNLRTRGVPHQMLDPEVVEKVVNSLKSRSQEEKQTSLNKLRDTWKNKTQEEKTEISNKNHNSRKENYDNLGMNRCFNGKPDYSNRNSAIDTTIKRIGFKSRMSDPEYRKNIMKDRSPYLYYGITFDSGWELIVWIYCIDNNIPIIREPVRFEFKDKFNDTRYCYPDFMINRKLVEVKGKQFFKPNGTMYCPYRGKDQTDEEYEYLCDLYERKHQCELANGVEFWKQENINYMKKYVNYHYGYGYCRIFRKDIFYNPSYWCFNLVPNGMIQPMYFIPISQRGINPYDIDKDKKYHFVKDNGLTPFDIK